MENQQHVEPLQTINGATGTPPMDLTRAEGDDMPSAA